MDEVVCSIVILSYNQKKYTQDCLESIRKYTQDVSYEIIVVDNASDQETIDYLEMQKDIILIKNSENLGFAGGCNQGILKSKGKYVMLLNNDTLVTIKWLYNMVELLEKDTEIEMTGPLTNSTVGKQMIPVPYGENMEEMNAFAKKIAKKCSNPWRTLRLVFFCVLIRKALFDKIGLLDTGFRIGNYEDDDFNLRCLTTSKKLYICRNSFVHHFMNISFRRNNLPREKIMIENKCLLENKWQTIHWNHHAGFNNYILENIIKGNSNYILHIGCGLGALAIELKDQKPECIVVGMENHPLRRDIAREFVDTVIDLSKENQSSMFYKLKERKFNCVIIEGSLEIYGIQLLEKVKEIIEKDAVIYMRVFNDNHISTLEKMFFGEVEGNLLCATSEEFRYRFDVNIRKKLEKINFKIESVYEVKKKFSLRQEQIADKLIEYQEFHKDCQVYNRIYKMVIMNESSICKIVDTSEGKNEDSKIF